MSDQAALAKETSPGAEPPRAAAASSENDAAVAVASGPDLVSETVAGQKDPEKDLEKDLEKSRAAEEGAPAAGHKNGSAEESVSAERSLDEKTPGDVVAAPPPQLVEEMTKEDAAAEPDEDDAQYLVGLPRLLLGFGLCVTTFLIGLDQMIIATAIPKIVHQFQSLPDVGWYGSAYLLTTTSLQPSFGKIYTYFNVKYTFIAALTIFEIGSVVCAVAPNSKVLIVGRAIAGSGAAGLFSGGMTIVGFTVPLRRRPIYIAAISSMFGVSSIVGPILGGAFTDRLTWRWCFWINLPFGAIAVLTVFFFFKSPKRAFTEITLKQKLVEMDFVGAGFLISAIVCLLLSLQWGGLQYPWSTSKVWGCMLGFFLLIIIFIAIQIRLGDRATIPARILKQRTILATALTLAFMSMGLFTHIYYLPFYFQGVKGTTAEQSGIRTIPYLVSNTVFAIVTGGLVTVFGYYTPFIWMGTALFAVGSGLIHTLKVDTPSSGWIGYQILAGGGSGAAIQLPFIAVQVVLSPKEMPTGNAVAIFFNSLGGAISLSIASNIFDNSLKRDLPGAGGGLDPAAVLQAGGTALRELVPAQFLPEVLFAYNKALTTAFILPIAVACLSFFSSLLFEWKSVKGVKLGVGGPGA